MNSVKKKFPQKMDSNEFVSKLIRHANWFSGVPDSVFKKIIPKLEPFYLASRENHSIAMGFGASLVGMKPAILIQNSGLGLSLDALFGLHQLYGVGILLIISNRGELDWEEIQHKLWGERSIDLLKLCDIATFDLNDLGDCAIEEAAKVAFDEHKISAVIIHRGNVDE